MRFKPPLTCDRMATVVLSCGEPAVSLMQSALFSSVTAIATVTRRPRGIRSNQTKSNQIHHQVASRRDGHSWPLLRSVNSSPNMSSGMLRVCLGFSISMSMSMGTSLGLSLQSNGKHLAGIRDVSEDRGGRALLGRIHAASTVPPTNHTAIASDERC